MGVTENSTVEGYLPSIQSIGSQNDGLNGGDGLNAEPHSVHPETPEPNDGLNGGLNGRKPLQDNTPSIQSIGSKLSEHLSDDEPNGVEVALEVFPGAGVVENPNAHLPDLSAPSAPSEPLGVDAEPDPSEQIAPLPWD